MKVLEAQSCGFVSAAHGVKGQLKVVLDQHIDLQKGTWCFLEFQKKPVPFFIEECTVSDDVAVLKLKGIDSPEQAGQLRAKAFLLPATEQVMMALEKSSDEGSYVGFAVWLSDEKYLGLITKAFDNSGQMLLEVKGNSQDYLVPFHEDWLEELEADKKKMVLRVPDGLLSL